MLSFEGAVTMIPMEQEPLFDWRTAIKNAVDLAAEDPEGFKDALRAAGRRAGMTVEEVYAKLQRDPEIGPQLRKMALNRLIQKGAMALRRFGF